ncbi:DNA repair exonuclease [Rhodobacter capsulatus]|uniref:DNA repair exonuclease SbcCD nuclease subunit n=1 Tax=Rhodobacter capsulatus TaxID=1061 RepID=A0A1G7MK05_RHOCA|nr:DNA repair exonuclease [Rhodobacter capsulatus]WER08772.1 DNA repair exonuclease [Rhodobacter capsulatus]SDF62228.1 DNA repair exonuclease SbcCD nuclease subunit [Rhodobacter capsulatus]
MIKILHTADIHLDSPLRSLALRNETLRDHIQSATRQAFARIIDTALAEGVAALLIAGDLFDGAQRGAKTAAFLSGQIERLRAAGIAVFYIKGNHDAENPITGEVALPDNVHVFDGRGGKVRLGDTEIWIHGVSFTGRHAPDSLLPKFAAPVPGAVNIAMLHSSLAGAVGHDTYAPCSVEDLAALGFDYWALGHIHKRQVYRDAPWIVMPGIPQGRDIGEAGAKSATLLTIEAGQITVQEVPTSVVTFLLHDIDVTGAESDDEIRQRVRSALHALSASLAPGETVILRLTLAGRSARHWQVRRDADIWAETAVQIAEETGRLWVEKLCLALEAPSATAADTTATDEIARLMAQISTEAGFAAQALAEVEEVLAQLPPARRAALLPDEAAMSALVRDLAASGGTHVVALMKGASE